MIKKLGILTALCLIGLHSTPVNAQDMSPEEQYKAQRQARPADATRPRLKMPQSIIVCRAKQCAPARLSMAKEYIFNTLLHMFDSNARQKALVCQGNANTHACTEEFVTVPIKVGVTPAYLYIDDVKIADVSISQQNTMALNLLLNWGVSYNGQTPVCRPSKNLLYVKNVNNVIMEDNGYNCKMTTVGNTTVSTMFAIDYIDLDYGYIGGYYSIGLSGPAFGGGSGYMILRLPNDISIEAKDFEAKPLEPKIEETIEETIEEIPTEQPKPVAAEPKSEKPILKKIEEAPVAPAAEPVHLSAPAMQNGYNTHGQYLYDSNTGQYIPLKVMENGTNAQTQPMQQPQSAPQPMPQPVPTPVVQQAQMPSPIMPTQTAPVVMQNNAAQQDPFQYAATARRSYGSAVSDRMPTDNELLSDVLAQTMPQTTVPLLTPIQQNGQTMLPQNQIPSYGQYFYDANRGQYVPLYGQYQFDPASGQYIPLSMLPAGQASQSLYTQAEQSVREPQAPNVSTIIKYNHPAQEYEKAKAEAAAEAERQRKVEKKKKEIEAQAIDFGGVKVFPIPSSNADRTMVEPTLKNSLNEYNHIESRRYE
ncbi:MAG: hypothetical protein IJ677_04865 [Alphaproteobacteria bacterium]|nr:hypothetical protein [Alphaproteobacteria bacterium]